MKRTKQLRFLVAAGVLAAGLTATQATPRVEDQTGADPTAGDEPQTKVEGKVVITTLNEDDKGAGTKQERRIIIHTDDGAKVISDQPGEGKNQQFVVRAVAKVDGGRGEHKTSTWLGLSTEEPSEALTSQLSLQPGEGLLITFVAPNSPAATAGLQKNDLLTEFDGQKLVLAAQLRKLVQMHKEGDKVDLGYYRGGKKQTASASLSKATNNLGLIGEGALDSLKNLQIEIKDLVSEDNMREGLRTLKDELAKAGVTRENIQGQVRKSMEEARRGIAEAVAQARQAERKARDGRNAALEHLAGGGVEVNKDATVTIKSKGESIRTMVTSDDTATIMLMANPKKHLTVHDKAGKLVFDGQIDTKEQQEKVPQDVWKKVEPMLEQFNQAPEAPEPPKAPAPPAPPTPAKPADPGAI